MELKDDINSVRDELNSVRDELKSDINSIRDELKSDINSIRNELKKELKEIFEIRVDGFKFLILKWMGGMMIATAGIVAGIVGAIVKFL